MPLHHYLPASFIARFSTDNRKKSSRDKLLAVGDKRTQKAFFSPAGKVGCINNLYTLSDDSTDPESIDKTWMEYEKQLPVVIDNLIQGEVDAETWTRVLIPFVACMLVRGPDFEERFNRRFTPMPEDLKEMLSPENANSARLRELQRLLTCVIAAKWIVLTTHGKDKLITNDLGYAPFINPGMGHQGLAIPIGQKTILAIIPSMEERPILYSRDEKWIPNIEYADLPVGNHQGLNRAIANKALRFVYGSDIQTVNKYFLGVPESPISPEPIELGFPDELLKPTFEFTWHRLVSVLRKKPSDPEAWDFALDWGIIQSGWHSMPFFPFNLIEFPPALQRIDNTIQLKFYDTDIYNEISQLPILQEDGKHGDVIKLATKALNYNLPPAIKAFVLSRRGGTLVDLKKTTEAIKDYEDACKIAPSNATIHVDYGYTLIKSANYHRAQDVLSTAIRLNPKIPAAYLNRGVALWNLGDFAGALADAKVAKALASDDIEKASAHVNLGQVYASLGNYKESADCYQNAAALYTEPTTKVGCLVRQALALAMNGQFDEALEIYNQAIGLDTSNLDALKGRALLHWRLGNQGNAIKDRDRALRYAPDAETKRILLTILDFPSSKHRSPVFYLLIFIGGLLLVYLLILFLAR